MEQKSRAFVILLAAYGFYFLYSTFCDADVPNLPDFYWGKEGQETVEDIAIRPFTFNIEDQILSDLKNRLKTEVNNSRLIKPFKDAGFQYGFNTNYLPKVLDYWLNKYDWRKREKLFNQLPQYKTKVSGLEIHFLRVRSNGGSFNVTRPLLMLHGWPSSFTEFRKMVPKLTDPQGSPINFEVIIPSLPGFGFSQPAEKPGLGPVEIGQLMLKFMDRLGYERFYLHGEGDGALIATHMASLYHDNVIGLHSTNCFSNHPRTWIKYAVGSVLPYVIMTPSEASRMHQLYFGTLLKESGYIHYQATKPDTIGVALSNSPSGLAAYILDKYTVPTNPENEFKEDGGLSSFDMDELLDNVMIYWVTNSITPSMRFFSEIFSSTQLAYKMDRLPTHTPVFCASFPHDIIRQPQALLYDKLTHLLGYTEMPEGGRFPGMEVPHLLAADIIKGFNFLEKRGLAFFEARHTCKINGVN